MNHCWDAVLPLEKHPNLYPTAWSRAKPVTDSPLLMVSNNPESVDDDNCAPGTATSGALCWHQPDSAKSIHRICLWHRNLLGEAVPPDGPAGMPGDSAPAPPVPRADRLSLTIENLGATPVVIRGMRCVWRTTSGRALHRGCQIAACYLKGSLDVMQPHAAPCRAEQFPLRVGAADTQTLLTFPWQSGDMTGAQAEIEFETVPTGPYRLRVVYHDHGTAPETISASVPPNPDERSKRPSPRGGWQFSEVQCFCDFTIAETGPAPALFEIYQPRDDTSFLFARNNTSRADQIACPRGKLCTEPNEGSWGAIIRIRLTVNNTSPDAKQLDIKVGPRGGGLEAGAIARDRDGIVNLTSIMVKDHYCPIDTIMAPPGCSEWDYSWTLAGQSNDPIALYVRPRR